MKRCLLLFAVAFCALCCSKPEPEAAPVLNFSRTKIELEVGETSQLAAMLIGATTVTYDFKTNPNNVTFESSDPTIAHVSASGLITAMSSGTVTVTAKSPSLTVKSPISVTVLLAPVTIRVISFNDKVDDRSGTTTSWEYRKPGALQMIKDLSPDLLGLQEAQPHQLTYLASNLPEYSWYGLGRDTGNVPATTESYMSEECMAIFYKKDVFEMQDCGTFWLSETPEMPTFGWDANYRRTCTWMKLKVKQTGQDVFYMNTHLDNKGSTAKAEGMKLIISKMSELAPKCQTVFLTADFNTKANSTVFDPLRPLMDNAREKALKTDQKNTFHNYGSSNSIIDHIWYKPTSIPLEYRTITEPFASVEYISDHYPIMADFQLVAASGL